MAHGFKDTTRTQRGEFNFTRTSTPVKPHSRAMPAKKAMSPPMAVDSDADGMARGGALSAKSRGALPKSDFGLPAERKYPMPDKSHAANAKARASQMAAKGALSQGAKATIDAKANKVLKMAEGGIVKGKERFANNKERSESALNESFGNSSLNNDAPGARDFKRDGRVKPVSAQDVHDYLENKPRDETPAKRLKKATTDGVREAVGDTYDNSRFSLGRQLFEGQGGYAKGGAVRSGGKPVASGKPRPMVRKGGIPC